jgi:gluconolactonase
VSDQDTAPLIGAGWRTLAQGLDHPECVCWSAAEGKVYAGGEAGQIYRFGPEPGDPELVTTIAGGFVLGVALDGDGNVYACDAGSGYVRRIAPDGTTEPYGARMSWPNYPAFDVDGNLWVSDSGAWDEHGGGLVRIAPGGESEYVDRSLPFANGLAVSGDHVYVVESQLPGVVRYPLAGGPPEEVVRLPRTVPDGLAFDSAGGLWIGLYQPSRVYRLDPSGRLDTVVDDWTGEYCMTPTNLCFAGPDLDVLVLASLCGWAVHAIDPGYTGAPPHLPRLGRG